MKVMWKDAVVIYFKVVSYIHPEELKKTSMNGNLPVYGKEFGVKIMQTKQMWIASTTVVTNLGYAYIRGYTKK
jgi:hypothetical protein